MDYPIRLNKYLSHNTKFSRREADRLITEGKIKINQKIITDLGTMVQEEDRVFLGNTPVRPKNDHLFTVIVYHKQKGELVTKRDDRGRVTIYETLPARFRHFIPIGRLDYASEGLLLLTDSPRVAQLLMESDLERVYKIKIEGPITPAMERAMQEGLILEDASAGGHEHSEISRMEFAPFVGYQIQTSTHSTSKLKVALSEGKNRELRRFFAHFGAKVLDLKRVGFGGVELNALPSGKYRFLAKNEYVNLRAFLRELDQQSL